MASTGSTIRGVLLAALAVAVLGACSSRGPMLHELGPQELYERAQRDFDAGRWEDAMMAAERLVTIHPGHPQTEQARYIIAQANFNRRQYATAAAEFTRLATDFPNGRYAEEARFKACKSYYELSPPVQLDQEYTKAAVDHCEALLRIFPAGEHAAEVREMVAELRDKLAEKVFIGGEFYYRRRAYDSAILYFEEVVEDHAGSSVAPNALLRLVQSYKAIGYNEEAVEAKEQLLRRYPDSEAARTARELQLADGPHHLGDLGGQ
jgi:outer membrane protein assembly factor BamD